MANNKQTPPPGAVSKQVVLESFGITPQGLGKWGLKPAGKVGREVYYNLEDVCRAWQEKRGKDETPEGFDGDEREAAKKLARDRQREEYLLAKERRIGQQQKNEIQAGTVIPVEFATFALSRISAQIASILDALPLTMRRAHPDLEPRHIDSFSREIARARNKAAEADELLPALVEEYVDTVIEAS